MHLAQRHRPPGKGIGIVMAGQQHSTATEWLAAGGFGFGFGLGGIEGGLPPSPAPLTCETCRTGRLAFQAIPDIRAGLFRKKQKVIPVQEVKVTPHQKGQPSTAGRLFQL